MQGRQEATLCPPVLATVGFMKRRLSELLAVPVEELRILLDARAVADGDTLLSLGVPTEMTLARVEVKKHQPGTTLLHVALEGEEHKLEALQYLLEALADDQLVVYCNDRVRVQRVARQLQSCGYAAAVQHGDLDQRERELALEGFHDGNLRVLVLTDAVPPRFLADIQRVPVVVNYDLPANVEDFGRRVFRSGCFSRRGVAISLLVPEAVPRLQDAERYYSVRIPELNLEDPVSIAERVALMREVVPHGHAERFHREELGEQPWAF